jgi:hypothetical protein
MANELHLGDKHMAEDFEVLALIFINLDSGFKTVDWFSEKSSYNLEYICFSMAYY